MKYDRVVQGSAGGIRSTVIDSEKRGYSGAFTSETSHDPFLPLVPAALATERIEIGTAIAVAFARSPMTLANIGYDLQLYSGGRFSLGLGTQIAPHIRYRFSMPWSRPAARMRELVLAMRAIWACWNDDAALDFRGEFYQHTLMTPLFRPEPHPYGAPKVFIAAVGPRMTEVAGEVGDGLLAHAFTTERFLREETVPALHRGRRSRTGTPAHGGEFEVSATVLAVTGRDEQELRAHAVPVRKQLAFYGSTPAYRAVLEKHGWGAVHERLHALSKQGRWDEMAELFDDEMLNAFAIVGEPGSITERIRARFGGLADRVLLSLPYDRDDVLLHEITGRS